MKQTQDAQGIRLSETVIGGPVFEVPATVPKALTERQSLSLPVENNH